MKRDMDFVRELMIAIERDPDYSGQGIYLPDGPEELGLSGRTYDELSYHLMLLIEAGFLDGGLGGRMPTIRRLTWNGHEFLEAVRDPSIWNRTKHGAEKAGNVGVEFV